MPGATQWAWNVCQGYKLHCLVVLCFGYVALLIAICCNKSHIVYSMVWRFFFPSRRFQYKCVLENMLKPLVFMKEATTTSYELCIQKEFSNKLWKYVICVNNIVISFLDNTINLHLILNYKHLETIPLVMIRIFQISLKAPHYFLYSS